MKKAINVIILIFGIVLFGCHEESPNIPVSICGCDSLIRHDIDTLFYTCIKGNTKLVFDLKDSTIKKYSLEENKKYLLREYIDYRKEDLTIKLDSSFFVYAKQRPIDSIDIVLPHYLTDSFAIVVNKNNILDTIFSSKKFMTLSLSDIATYADSLVFFVFESRYIQEKKMVLFTEFRTNFSYIIKGGILKQYIDIRACINDEKLPDFTNELKKLQTQH